MKNLFKRIVLLFDKWFTERNVIATGVLAAIIWVLVTGGVKAIAILSIVFVEGLAAGIVLIAVMIALSYGYTKLLKWAQK